MSKQDTTNQEEITYLTHEELAEGKAGHVLVPLQISLIPMDVPLDIEGIKGIKTRYALTKIDGTKYKYASLADCHHVAKIEVIKD
jgi:hypothetical protein